MFRKLTRDQRGRIAEKIMELGNLIFVGLVIAQFVPNISINLMIIILGFVMFIVIYIIAIRFMEGGARK